MSRENYNQNEASNTVKEVSRTRGFSGRGTTNASESEGIENMLRQRGYGVPNAYSDESLAKLLLTGSGGEVVGDNFDNVFATDIFANIAGRQNLGIDAQTRTYSSDLGIGLLSGIKDVRSIERELLKPQYREKHY